VLARILQAENRGLVMIFARTKRQAQSTADELSRRGFKVAAVHGDLNQQAREKSLASFRSGKVDVLVATDVAARGIDVEGVTHVINASCPEDEKTYLHRIGRTGRAGASGVAITLVDWEDISRWTSINSALNLPYPDPPETYSTSEHLYHDLGIPPGIPGRLPGGPAEAPDRPEPDRRGRGTGRSTGQGQQQSGQRGRRARGRDTSAGRSASSAGTGGTDTGATDVSGTAGPKRRRRRTRGGSSTGSPAAPTSSE
jgi:superfamily II DNA/RNA helicase